ncbi:MAG: FHA domain-containing protein [Acidobacteria bacterium]|nr:FHA domain-containing protein [Acidobacteriota bacterium]MCW5950559.1 FHA domain-containing protein [Pyrinomonadaceae bacterium]
MLKCSACGKENTITAKFCDECGNRLERPFEAQPSDISAVEYVPPLTDPGSGAIHSTVGPEESSAGEKPFEERHVPSVPSYVENNEPAPGSHTLTAKTAAKLVIEKGDRVGTEFPVANDESTIGRWDADNGVFPDIDLDQFDSEAKVSRRHAKIKLVSGKYFVEDLGSTNGTYINRGRRLLPGTPAPLNDGDELIVGKTFLRFHILN